MKPPSIPSRDDLTARARGLAPLSMVAVTLRAGQQGLSRHHAGTMPVVDMDRLEQLPTALRRAL